MRRGYGVSGGRFAGRPTGQYYADFHSALMRKCYPKSDRASTGTPVIIKTPQGNRFAGQVQAINGIPVFVKHVVVSKHLQRNMDAWGIDSRVLDLLEQRSVLRIRVITDKGEVYDTSMDVFYDHGIICDFGYGSQVFLPRRYWLRGKINKFGGSGEGYGS
ncbi:MAG: hypothetical protein ABFD83_13520 [Armatimonadota bacterium]